MGCLKVKIGMCSQFVQSAWFDHESEQEDLWREEAGVCKGLASSDQQQSAFAREVT